MQKYMGIRVRSGKAALVSSGPLPGDSSQDRERVSLILHPIIGQARGEGSALLPLGQGHRINIYILPSFKRLLKLMESGIQSME